MSIIDPSDLTPSPVKILIVCLGNICRSPTAEVVLRARALMKGKDIVVDSAGTINYHEGASPDQRSIKAGELRGYHFNNVHSRQITMRDFEYFDLIFAADRCNLDELFHLCPIEHQRKLSLFLTHAHCHEDEIPDPYYGGEHGFELVLDLVEQGSDAILDNLPKLIEGVQTS